MYVLMISEGAFVFPFYRLWAGGCSASVHATEIDAVWQFPSLALRRPAAAGLGNKLKTWTLTNNRMIG